MIVSKLPNVGTTIFTTMSVLAAEHKAINLGQGFPDFPMNEELVAMVDEAMRKGFNQYVHMNGYVPLREAIAEKVEFLYQTKIDPDTQITVTPGGTYALYTALTTILQPGDEVIVFEPAYDCYIPAIELNGARAVAIQLTFPDYRIDWAEVKKQVTGKTRAIILNSPHNPTGSVLSAEDIAQLREVVKDTGIIIISDEVYEHLILDGHEHQSILKYPDLMERSFVSFSFGKVYHCTGWKLGYSIASEYLMSEFRKIHQYNAFCSDTPSRWRWLLFCKSGRTIWNWVPFCSKNATISRQAWHRPGWSPCPPTEVISRFIRTKTYRHKAKKSLRFISPKSMGWPPFQFLPFTSRR
jgi:methionine aminotransferase